MIAVEVLGRMGNQMFMYAFAVSASERLSCPFVLSYNVKEFQLPEYFACRRFSSLRNRCFALLYRAIGPWLPRQDWDSSRPPASELARLKRFTTYFGYMQSEEYFAPFQELIRSEFKVLEAFTRPFASQYGDRLRRARTVVLHFRRTDYQQVGSTQLGFDLRLPLAYYDACLNQIKDLAHCQVILVGDDLRDAEEHYRGRPNFFFERNEQMVDFQLIQGADIAIISNSSFAWWAAYLGKPGRTIFAPKNWLGFKAGIEHPAGICSVPWRWVDVPGDKPGENA